MGLNRRRHQRIPHDAIVKVVSGQHVIQRKIRDFSDSGTFVLCEEVLFKLNEHITIQTVSSEDSTVVESRVVRIERNYGFAVEFAA
jgi:hypothetical protein